LYGDGDRGRMDRIWQLVEAKVSDAGQAERAQMKDAVLFDLGWFIPEPDCDPARERDEVAMIMDAFADPDCTGLYLDGDELDADRIASCTRGFFADAEGWLLAGRQRHVYEWSRDENDYPVGCCVIHGTPNIGIDTLLCNSDVTPA
jgi:hypothetical protein